MNEKPKFSVIYLKQAQKYLYLLDNKTRTKIFENIDLARYTLNPELLKKLTGEIWEFCTLHNGIKYRLLAFWDKRDNTNTLVVATHGFIKKENKVPNTEINKALEIRKNYFNENK
jgi:mRNA-degrading endonuclease RelE of RelBE toxin-antitoxin system